LSDGVDEDVDQVMAGLWGYAGEQCLQSAGCWGIGVADDRLGVGSEVQRDAPLVV
jgi:hypothetical protein